MRENAFSFRARRLGRNLLRSVALSFLMLASGPGATPQSANPPEVQVHATTPKFRIRAERNVVLVRVVVRDAKQRTVGDLHKEDFQLFDDGKPQEVTAFSVETASPKSATTEVRSSPAASTDTATPILLPSVTAAPQRLKARELGEHATPLGATCRPVSSPRNASPSSPLQASPNSTSPMTRRNFTRLCPVWRPGRAPRRLDSVRTSASTRRT